MMEAKSKYKMTEVGEIPVEWEVKELDSISKVIMGQSPKSSSYNDEGEGLPFYQGRSEFGDKYPIPMKWCTDPSKIAEKDDVLFTVRAPVGDVNMCQEKSCIGRGLGAIRYIENTTNQWFLYYSLLYSKEKFSSLSQGSTFTAINGEELRKFKLPKPPIKEQQKIAEILSTVDEQIDQTNQLIEKTKELKKGLMQQLLKKGLGHNEFKQSELGEIPVEWKIKKLGEVTKIVNGGTPSKSNDEYWEDGTILWATPTDITKNKAKYIKDTEQKITQKGLNKSSASLLPKGSILMTSRATIGEKSINLKPMATNQGFKSFICKESLFNEYLYYYIDILKPLFLSKASGSTFLEISKKTTEDQLIALPSLKEQQQIAKILSSVDEDIEGYEEEKVQYEELKKGLMQQLLTGKTRVIVE